MSARPPGPPWLPYLPVEWLALAVPVSAWLTARRGEPVALTPTLLLTGLLVVGGALVETCAVPF